MLIIVHRLILIIKKNNFSVSGEDPIADINDGTGAAGKRFSTKANAKIRS